MDQQYEVIHRQTGAVIGIYDESEAFDFDKRLYSLTEVTFPKMYNPPGKIPRVFLRTGQAHEPLGSIFIMQRDGRKALRVIHSLHDLEGVYINGN